MGQHERESIALVMIYHILNGHDVNFSKNILEYMEKVRKQTSNSYLQYANLLAQIFGYFKIPSESEEFTEISIT